MIYGFQKRKYKMVTKEQLINIGVEKLADIILSLCQNKPDVQKQLKIIVAGFDSDPKKCVAMIKKEIASLKRSNRFIDLKQSGSLADQINQIRIHIMEDLLPKSPNRAIELLLNLLDIHESTLERTDDSGGTVGDAFEQACADLGKAYEHLTNSLADKKDIVKLVYDRFMNDGYSVYAKIIWYFKDALGDDGLKQLKQKFEQSVNQKNGTTMYGASTNNIALKSIADCQNNVDDYIQACSSAGGLNASDHLDIARRLIKHYRSKEAIELLDSNETGGLHWQEDKMALKVQALDLCGDHKKAQEERQKWFDITLSPKVYNEILKYGEAGFIESWKKTAIQKAFEFHDSHIALNFLREIQEFEQAAKLVYQKIDTLNGNNYYTLRPIADILCNIHPLAATLLYRKLTEVPLEKTRSKYYNYAAKDLAVCHSLSSKVTDWRGYKNHQHYFEELSVQHKRKRSFWSEYNYALNKRQKVTM